MSSKPDEAVIIIFRDNVPEEQIAEYARDIEANGGKVNHRYYESGGLNGFSATIPEVYLQSFKSFQADKISYIESDGIVTTQANA